MIQQRDGHHYVKDWIIGHSPGLRLLSRITIMTGTWLLGGASLTFGFSNNAMVSNPLML